MSRAFEGKTTTRNTPPNERTTLSARCKGKLVILVKINVTFIITDYVVHSGYIVGVRVIIGANIYRTKISARRLHSRTRTAIDFVVYVEFKVVLLRMERTRR